VGLLHVVLEGDVEEGCWVRGGGGEAAGGEAGGEAGGAEPEVEEVRPHYTCEATVQDY
jgi:hypothetical protein